MGKTRNKGTTGALVDAIWKDVDATTIPDEIKALYMMAMATELMSSQIKRRIDSLYLRHGLRATGNGMLTGINQYCEFVQRAAFLFEQRIEPQILGATWFAGMDEDKGERPKDVGKAALRYDQFLNDAGVLCRLVLLFIDRAGQDEEAYRRVFDTLRDLPTHDVYKEEDITRYKTKV